MKNAIYLLVLAALCIIMIQCEKDKNEDLKVSHINTILGGCNNQDFGDLKSTAEDQNDTLQFYIRNDTLNVFVGINYICCAPFVTEFSQSADSLFFTISDTCSLTSGNCYCRCMCYYTFDFLFDSFAKKTYFFRIIINDPRQQEPVIFSQGTVDLVYK